MKDWQIYKHNDEIISSNYIVHDMLYQQEIVKQVSIGFSTKFLGFFWLFELKHFLLNIFRKNVGWYSTNSLASIAHHDYQPNQIH